jgi:hypothetical protein
MIETMNTANANPRIMARPGPVAREPEARPELTDELLARARRRDFLPTDPAERAARLEARVVALQRNGLRLRDEAIHYRAALLRLRSATDDPRLLRLVTAGLAGHDHRPLVTDAEAADFATESGVFDTVLDKAPANAAGR